LAGAQAIRYRAFFRGIRQAAAVGAELRERGSAKRWRDRLAIDVQLVAIGAADRGEQRFALFDQVLFRFKEVVVALFRVGLAFERRCRGRHKRREVLPCDAGSFDLDGKFRTACGLDELDGYLVIAFS